MVVDKENMQEENSDFEPLVINEEPVVTNEEVMTSEPVKKKTIQTFENESTDPDALEVLTLIDESDTSKEAAKILERANRYNMSPDDYAKNKKYLDPNAKLDENVPAKVDPTLIDIMKASYQMAVFMKPEIGILNDLPQIARHMHYNAYGKRDLDQQIMELESKNMESPLPAHELEFLDSLLDMRQKESEKFTLSGPSQVPGLTAGVVGDYTSALKKNAGLILGATGAGAAIGGILGGGVLSPITATSVALSTGGTALAGVLAYDAYKRISTSTYSELRHMKDKQGNPLNLPRDTMDNISKGVAVVSAALEFGTSKLLTGGLAKLGSKEIIERIVMNPGLKTATNLLGHILKSGGVGAAEESVSELASIVGEHYARGHKSEAGLANAIHNAYLDVKENRNGTWERLGMTAAVGFVATGVTSGVPALVLTGKAKRGIEKTNFQIVQQRAELNVIENSIRALQNQNDLFKASSLTIDTDMKKLSPEEFSKVRKEIFEKAGRGEKYYFTEADLEAIESKSPELAEKLKMYDVTESAANNTGASIGVPIYNMLDLVEEFPTVAEHARMNPEAPNPLESRVVLDEHNKREAKRKEIIESLGGKELTPEQVDILSNLDKNVQEAVRDAGEEGYLDSPTFPENNNRWVVNRTKKEISFLTKQKKERLKNATSPKEKEVINKGYNTKIKELTKQKESYQEGLADVLTEKQVESFNKAQREARESVAKQINDEINAKEIREENRIVREQERTERNNLDAELKEQLRVLENFKPAKKKSKTDAGRRKLTINPDSLPDDMREAYVTEPNLIKRKVFAKKGITLTEAASITGVEDGETLLKILANAPDKNEIKARQEKLSKSFRERIKKISGETIREKREVAFDKISKIHLKEIEFMKSDKWGALKTGVKFIALPAPNIAAINNNAKAIINNTKVGELNVKQYNAGEKFNQRKAVNHILKNEVEPAIQAKEKAILNNELTREALKARDKINKAKDFVKKITGKKGQNNLKKGKMQDEVNELLTLFDLRSNKPKGLQKPEVIDSLRTINAEGNSVIVDEAILETRQLGSELSVEKYLGLVDRLRTLDFQAKQNNKLFKENAKRAAANKLLTMEATVADQVANLEQNPNYDKKRLDTVKNKNSKTMKQKFMEMFGLSSASNTNFKNIITELDMEALLGDHYSVLAQPLIDAETYKRTRLKQVVDHIKRIVADYGEEDFKTAMNDFIEIPEFKGYRDLGNGSMSRSDLWILFSYLGDPEGRKRMENFTKGKGDNIQNLDADIIQNVMDRVLTGKDAKLAQNFINIYKNFEQEGMDLHERTTGVSPTMVKGVPIVHRGKVLPGGYVHIKLLRTSESTKLQRFLDVMGNRSESMFGLKEDNKLYSQMIAAGHTDQGRLNQRTNTTQPLDTDFRNFLHSYEEHIHDLAYREAGSDTLKLLKNEAYSDAIISTVGLEKYQLLGNAVIETVGKSSEVDHFNPTADTSRMAMNFQKWLEQGFNISVLGFNMTSVAMQPLSYGAAKLRMGPTGGRYLVKATGQILANATPEKYTKLFDFATTINPDLLFNMDSIDDTMIRSTYDFIRKTSNAGKHSQKLAILKAAREKTINASMWGLKQTDIQVKFATTLASYAQFMDGNVKNYPMSRLDKMTDAQKETKARQYVKQVADLALTTSAEIDKTNIEKIAFLRLFTRFYTDLRSQRNTMLSEGRKIKQSGKQAIKAYKEGDTDTAIGHAKDGAMTFASVVAVQTLSQMYISTLYGEKNPIKELANIDDMGDFGNFLAYSTSYALTSPVKSLVGSTVGLRDIQYAMGSKRRQKQVTLPMNKVFSDIATISSGIKELLLEGDGMSKSEFKAAAYTLSYITGGLPINGPTKLRDALNDSDVYQAAMKFLKKEAKNLSRLIGEFASKHPEQTEKIAALREIESEIVPLEEQDVKDIIPEDAYEVLKTSDWTKVDPETGAAGVYQFTEAKWNEISEIDPDLNLTDEGRVSKDTTEQDRAMKWETERNAQGLKIYGEEVTNANLFGAHRFGLDDFVAILMASDKTKISSVVKDNDLFKGFKTVRQVKNYVKTQTKKIN